MANSAVLNWMSRPRMRMFALVWLMLAPILIGHSAQLAQAAGRDFYVAPSGVDSNAGTLLAPFQTIQHCADMAIAGDTCYIRAGTYRETIQPSASGTVDAPITFKPYNDEVVTVSGADILTGWTSHQGAIAKTVMPWTVFDPARGYPIASDQIFVDGHMMVEARWPNIPVDQVTALKRQRNAISESGRYLNDRDAEYTLANLEQFPTNMWSGGKIYFLPGFNFTANTCDITGNTNNLISIRCPAHSFPAGPLTIPNKADGFYLFGKYEALDAPGEWFREPSGALYLWPPDSTSPAGHLVEAKRRLWAFDLRGRKNIMITGLQIFAASIATDTATENVALREIDARYIWHFNTFRLPAPYDTNGDQWYPMSGMAGLVLNGTNISIEDSSIAYSAADGVVFQGTNNRLINTVLHDVNYMAGGHAITSDSANAIYATVRQNTIFNSGRSLATIGKAINFTYNDFYNSHLQSMDAGAVYAYASDGQGSQVAYNLVHDAMAERNTAIMHWGSAGIYLDDDTYNYSVYRNIVWNTSSAGILVLGSNGTMISPPVPFNTPSNRKVFNNTVDGSIAVQIKTSPKQNALGVEYRNNVAFNYAINTTDVISSTNFRGNAQFIDRANRNYQLSPYSPVINTGINIPGITDGYTGSAPDLGALEYGQPPFVAGALLRPRDLAGLRAQCMPKLATQAVICQINDLPIGRKVAPDFQLRIGSDPPTQSCTNQMNYFTNLATVSCEVSSVTEQTSAQPIFVRLGAGAWVDTGETFALHVGELPGPTISSVSPTTGAIDGGMPLTITGNNFNQQITLYQTPLTISNATGHAVLDQQVLVTLNSAALIAQGKLRRDCGDLRFRDQYAILSYWIESGCNTPVTQVWVRASYLLPGSSTLYMIYGDGALSSSNDGHLTFSFFDDFEDGQIDPSWQVRTNDGLTVRETGGQMRIAGTTTTATQYALPGFSILQTVAHPDNFVVESELSVVKQSAGSKARGIMGSDTNVIGFYTDQNGRKIGYYDGTRNVSVANSQPSALTFDSVKISVIYRADGSVSYYEGGQLKGMRSGLSNPAWGSFYYGPNVAGKTIDVHIDNVRVRQYMMPEPVVSIGTEVQVSQGTRVFVAGKPCGPLTAASSTLLTCFTPPGTLGAADVTVINADGKQSMRAAGFVYSATPAPVISGATPASGDMSGGTEMTISGSNFDQHMPLYQVPVTIQNASGKELQNYQVLITFDSGALIGQGKLRGDCGGLRFSDGTTELPYWIERGCNSPATKVWVRVPVLPPGSSSISMLYGNGALSSGSDARLTFPFFEDFEDGQIDQNVLLMPSATLTVTEAGGQMRIAGTTTDATRFNTAGFRIRPSVALPDSFMIESEVSAVKQPTDSTPKGTLGGDTNVIGFYTDQNGRKIGYYDGTHYVAVGDSKLDALTSATQKISVVYRADGSVSYYENGQLKGTRSGLSNPGWGNFSYGPNAAGKTIDVRIDNVRIRQYVAIEPTISLGSEVQVSQGTRILVAGKPCVPLAEGLTTAVTCLTPPGSSGTADIVVINPDGQQAALPNGFTYKQRIANRTLIFLPWVQR